MMPQSSPAQRPVLGVSLAVFRHGRVLVATRTKPPFTGAYSLPGGHLEAGETLQEAALRELYEEVGVTARIIAFNQHVETIRWEGAKDLPRHFVIASFVGTWLAGEARPGAEAGEVMWVAPHDLQRLPTTPGLIPVVEAASNILTRENVE
jgi:ADP-ribose pyrophosphatase YjhB (NUDIX family)